jgi:hypothetical protein
LFLEIQKDESIDEALARSDFDEIAEVLNALRENDDELSDNIQTLTVERGETGGFDESRLRDKIEVLGPQIAVDELAGSIFTRLIHELGVTWDERYGQLLAYNETYGNCNVPAKWKDNPPLGHWCSNQRTHRARGAISPDHFQRLEGIGFQWDPQDVAWETMLAALIAYTKIHGDCNVPARWRDNPKLASWCNTQRQLYKNNGLPIERIRRLTETGFQFSLLAATWEKMFTALTTYRHAHGDCNVPAKWKDNPQLGQWCGSQRNAYRNKALSPDRSRRFPLSAFSGIH